LLFFPFGRVRFSRNADVIRTDPTRMPGALIRKSPEGKKDPRQKKERGKGQQNKNQRTGLLAGPVWKIPFKAVPTPAPPRRIWRGASAATMLVKPY